MSGRIGIVQFAEGHTLAFGRGSSTAIGLGSLISTREEKRMTPPYSPDVRKRPPDESDGLERSMLRNHFILVLA